MIIWTDPSSTPDALLMRHMKLFIPLSMLTPSMIARICYNDNLKYKKIPFGLAAGKYTLDDSHFPPESSLTDTDYMQAHKHWIALIKLTANADIYKGWNAHHDAMMGYDDLST